MIFDTSTKKKQKMKLMLWVDVSTVEALDSLRPKSLTVQECIRQILSEFVTSNVER